MFKLILTLRIIKTLVGRRCFVTCSIIVKDRVNALLLVIDGYNFELSAIERAATFVVLNEVFGKSRIELFVLLFLVLPRSYQALDTLFLLQNLAQRAIFLILYSRPWLDAILLFLNLLLQRYKDILDSTILLWLHLRLHA